MVISVRLRAPCGDETGLRPPKFPATTPFRLVEVVSGPVILVAAPAHGGRESAPND